MVTYIRLDPWERIAQFCQSAIGKTPKQIHVESDSIVLVFDPSLTATDKQTLQNAMPDMIQKLFRITVTDE